MWSVYIIQSQLNGRLYIGFTENIVERVHHHNKGTTKSTKPSRPWKLVHLEKFASKTEARKRELQLKRMKHGNGLRALL